MMNSAADERIGREAIGAWIARLELRSTLDDEDRATLTALPFEVHRIGANRDFVRLGECASHACLIADGWAGRFGQTGDGDRLVTAIHMPGDMCDLHSTVAPLAASALQALCATTIVQVPHSAVKQVADARPTLARAFWRDCVVDALILSEWVLNIGRRAALPRLAHMICESAVRSAAIGVAKGPVIPFPLTQAQLGDAAALTAVHVNRMLRDLRDAELVTVRDRVAHIHDWRALTNLADFRADYLHLDKAIVVAAEAALTGA